MGSLSDPCLIGSYDVLVYLGEGTESLHCIERLRIEFERQSIYSILIGLSSE